MGRSFVDRLEPSWRISFVMIPLPALRPIDVMPMRHQGAMRFLLKDLEGFSEKAALLDPEEFFVAACLDGKSTMDQIRSRFARRFNMKLLPSAKIEKILAALDECHLLDSPRFQERRTAVKKEYEQFPRRRAALANESYPGEEIKLMNLLDQFFVPPGPGREVKARTGNLIGLVAPHIDFLRGGVAYAWAYQEMLSRLTADLYVILGVAHAGPPLPFILTLKDFETPLGLVATDRDLGNELMHTTGVDLAQHEFVLRREHSIEFQAVWLKYVSRKREGSFKILPLACAHFAQNGGDPEEPVHRVLEELAHLAARYPGKVCFLAGVDLSHVGPRFGDQEPVKELVRWIEFEDQKSLRLLEEKNSLEFYRSAMIQKGKRKVCGASALYAFSWLMQRLYPQAQGRLLKYGHAPDPAGGEVSFASMAFVV
ncbi:MAG: AmmeMemoRadiSam system protein B [Elusimicrobia bacterium]|nr:AmmeMemoRadiSam system protein B [Elusimicrobiota bacterium]